MPIMANDPRQEIINGLEFWNLSDAWLAERSGYSAQNIGNWIRRGRSPLDAEVWDRLIDCLPQKELTGPLIPVSFPLAKLPYAGVVPCGNWGDPLDSQDFIEIDSEFVGSKNFVTGVLGASCWPALRPGDTVVWRSDTNPRFGVIVLAQRLVDHATTVKELVYDADSGRSRLMPINPQSDEADDPNGWIVIARLIGVIRRVDGLKVQWSLEEGLRRRHFD